MENVADGPHFHFLSSADASVSAVDQLLASRLGCLLVLHEVGRASQMTLTDTSITLI